MAIVKRKIIEIDNKKCDGCGLCVPACPEAALEIVDTSDGKKVTVSKEFYCDGLGACLDVCPTGALKVVEREAEEYDDSATIEHIKETAPDMLEEHIKHMKEHSAENDKSHDTHQHQNHFMGGCPGSRMMAWDEDNDNDGVKTNKVSEPIKSELKQWPVQLNLVNPAAPYFKNANIVITADCVPFAYAGFHQDFLKGNSLIIGCPKLDDADFYQKKLTELFRVSGPASITVVNMEVPCCFGLMNIVQNAIKESGKDIPLNQIVITIKGEVKE